MEARQLPDGPPEDYTVAVEDEAHEDEVKHEVKDEVEDVEEVNKAVNNNNKRRRRIQ